MAWRVVVINSIAKLDYKMGYLMIRTKEENHRVHIKEISTLIIGSTSVSLTAYLLTELAEQKVNVVFCDAKRNPAGLYVSLSGSHDSSRAIRQQIGWTKQAKEILWQKVIANKIIGQAAVLDFTDHHKESEKLRKYVEQIEPGDATNREGHAAKVYFDALFGMDFTRTDEENPINAELNYGYSILLSAVAREIVSNGCITQLGIHHDNVFNPWNLACDLMEPFRPYIDLQVFHLTHGELDHEKKIKLISVLNYKIKLNGRDEFFSNALSIYVKNCINYMESQDNKINFPAYELSSYASDCVF